LSKRTSVPAQAQVTPGTYVYVDTSFLAKWYLNEPGSEAAAAWFERECPVAISSMTLAEMASLLARRRRMGEIDATLEARIHAALDDDLALGYLECHPVPDRAVLAAARLFASLPDQPLRTLDALHLALARELALTRLATADRVLAGAARALGFTVEGLVEAG
jgi:predicted nucleic acid-binding protein